MMTQHKLDLKSTLGQRVASPALSMLINLSMATLASAQICNDWRHIQDGPPLDRDGHTMAFDPLRGKTVMFGGSRSGPELTDTWEWDGSEWVQKSNTGPLPSYRAAAAFMDQLGAVVMFGRNAGDTSTWKWDGEQWSLIPTEHSPPGRTAHAMAYDSRRQMLVLFGGTSSTMDDTWEFDGTDWREIEVVRAPGPRKQHAMAYDPVRGVVVLFGGQSTSERYNDTWDWDGVRWRQRETNYVDDRWDHALVYDPVARVMLCFAGITSLRNNETWFLDGNVWTQSLRSAPPRRENFDMVFDTNRGAAVVFGGQNYPSLDDTWEWTHAMWFREHPQPMTVVAGEAVEFAIVDAGPDARTFQWRQNGVPLTNGGGVFGANTPSLRIAPTEQRHAGEYDCALIGSCGQVLSDPARLNVIDPLLSVSATCPEGGRATIQWDHATPDRSVAVILARSPGWVRVPGGRPCAGTRLGLSQDQIQVLWQGESGENGMRSIEGSLLPNACDAHLQLLDIDTCMTSNVVRVE